MLSRLQRGLSLVELMIGLAIVSILLLAAVPNFGIFLQNIQIRNASESVLQGLNLARTEALRRNEPVRFQFVSDLTGDCTLATNSLNWVVSTLSAAGLCDEDPGVTPPEIVQKQSARDGTPNVALASDASTITFNGLGRASTAATIDLSSVSGSCEHLDADGTMRCLRILVSAGGQIKLCDPKVDLAGTDPRRCA
jgi:type IV fimbrial biogenesis protein FimT